MKFKVIVRECHVPDKYLIARLWTAILIGKEEKVLAIHAEPIGRQLSAGLAMCFNYKLFGCLPPCLRVSKEADGEAAVRQLADLLSQVQRVITFHCIHSPKVGIGNAIRKDNSPRVLAFVNPFVIFPEPQRFLQPPLRTQRSRPRWRHT